MEAGVFGLMANTGVAALFALSFLAIALTDSGQQHARRFAVVYVIGLLTPLSEILVRYSQVPAFFSVVGYVAFLAAQLMTAHCVARFFGQRDPWRILAMTMVAGVVIRLAIWGGPRDWLPYELAYQAPFAAAMILASAAAMKARPRRLLTVALAVDFALIAAHYPVKAVVSTFLRSGTTAQAYASSAYAVFSQALSGMLLTSAGLILLLLVFEESVTRSRREAHNDALSGLYNRRGFFDRAAEHEHLHMLVIVFDLDHFKRINDTRGHAVGDAVIAAFAGLLRRLAPGGALVGRMGGEEFVLAAPEMELEAGMALAEQVRRATETLNVAAVRFTVSAGVATRPARTSLDVALRRADQALYAAKQAGRNQVCRAHDDTTPQLIPPSAAANRERRRISRTWPRGEA